MARRMLFSMALASLLTGAVRAQEVYCGSFTPIKFRASAGGKDPAARANQAMDVINKYLGGKAPAVTTRSDKAGVKLMIQRDTVAVVTAADAKAEKAKNPTVLAKSWSAKLSKALKASCAQK